MAEIVVKNRDTAAFEEAFSKAMPGDRIIYHVGRTLDSPCGTYAHYLYGAGLVLLVQRRSIADGFFEYIAVRTKRYRGDRVSMPKNYKVPEAV